MTKIRIGVIGRSPSSTLSVGDAHGRALQSLPQFELCGVSRCDDEAGLATMVGDRDLDIVVAAAGSAVGPATIEAALRAGKIVVGDWPLGCDEQEAADLAALARTIGVRTVLSMPGHYAPAVHHARQLVRRGFVGQVLTTTWIGSSAPGEAMPALLHALDAMSHVLGDMENVAAMVGSRRLPPGHAQSEFQPISNSDRVVVSGQLRTGALISACCRGGVRRRRGLHWEINGADGDLVLSASDGDVRAASLSLQGGCRDEESLTTLDLPPSLTQAGGSFDDNDPAANIRRMYIALAADLRHGTAFMPDFDHAVDLHRLLAQLVASASGGGDQQRASQWPLGPGRFPAGRDAGGIAT